MGQNCAKAPINAVNKFLNFTESERSVSLNVPVDITRAEPNRAPFVCQPMTTQPLQTRILTADQLQQKIRRIAFQIYENNFDEPGLVLAGVAGEGFIFAQALVLELRQIAPMPILLLKIDLDKTQPSQPAVTISPETDFRNQVVIVADDVLNSGRTLAFALQAFLNVPLRKLQVAVLVDRNHPRYPVAADYRGYALSTTLAEHVEVVLSDVGRMGIYLQ